KVASPVQRLTTSAAIASALNTRSGASSTQPPCASLCTSRTPRGSRGRASGGMWGVGSVIWRSPQRLGCRIWQVGGATGSHPRLEGEGRPPERSEGGRGGVAATQQIQYRICVSCWVSPHPGSLRSPTLPLQGRVAPSARRGSEFVALAAPVSWLLLRHEGAGRNVLGRPVGGVEGVQHRPQHVAVEPQRC